MKLLPIGRQNFQALIEEDLLYIDKTQQIYELVRQGRLYFLSRPRRFGKSLLVSTLKHLFSGNRALFEQLYIGKETDYDWQEYPVLQFNFASYGHKVEELESILLRNIDGLSKDNGVVLSKVTLTERMSELVEKVAAKGQPVVILIDEYDKPIVDFLTQPEKAKVNQKVLRDFFSPLKNLEAAGHLRFLFITGVSKFSKVSLFSDLNNLVDLTIHPLSKDIVGITQKELESAFKMHIKRAAKEFKTNIPTTIQKIKKWYNGYSFDGETFLYNPFSLLNFFQQYRFRNYWFATGTPTFLVETIRDRGIDPRELEQTEVPDTFFDRYSLEKIDLTGLLFQTGYLTIKRVRTRHEQLRYSLDYPNMEVRLSFYRNLVEAFTYKTPSTVGTALLKMQDALDFGQPAIFFQQLRILLSDISYHLQPRKQKAASATFAVWEGYFQTIVYLVTSFLGVFVQTEITKHQGRLDLIAETEDFIYLMEFKLDESAEDALQQIADRQYAAAYQNSTKTIFLIGVNFSKEERNIEEWKIEEWKR